MTDYMKKRVNAAMDAVDENLATLKTVLETANADAKKREAKIVGSRVLITYRASSGYLGNMTCNDRGNSNALVEAMKECARVLLIEGRLDEIVDALNQTFRLSDEASQEVLHIEKRIRLKD